MDIRMGTPADAEALAEVEALCFPAAEAAGKADFRARLAVYPDHFWLLEEDGRLLAFVNGMVSRQPRITDDLFEDPSRHCPDGPWQLIFGVATRPECRKQGLAGRVLRRVIDDARAQGRRGVVLTCKERLIPFYQSFGFENRGVSNSVHGGVVWYDMVLEFPPKPDGK